MTGLAGVRIRDIIIGLIALAGSGCGSPDEDGGEEEMVIGSDIACPSCSIALESVVTLEDATLVGPVTSIARDPAGVTYIIDYSDQFRLKVYGDDGGYVQQIGRPGGGPGEYEFITSVLIGRDGVIHVLDRSHARHSMFTRGGEFVEAVTVPRLAWGIGSAALLPDDRIVISAGRDRMDPEGALLRVIDQQGNATALGEAFRVDQRKPWLQERLLRARGAGGLFVAEPYTFTIEIYDANLARRRRIRRSAEWLPAKLPDEPSDGVFDKPYTPALNGIWEDDDGLLWLTMMIPSKSWKPAEPRALHELDEKAAELVKRPRLDTIIEVVDLERGRVLARLRLPGPQGFPLGGGYFAGSVDDDSLSEPGVRISRVQLRWDGSDRGSAPR